jgi:hypothetical protein
MGADPASPEEGGCGGMGARCEAKAAAMEPYARVRWDEVGAVSSFILGVSEMVFSIIGVNEDNLYIIGVKSEIK